MANRYWVGGTASWDGTAGSKWASTSGGAGGQAIPTASDDVFFDASSGAGTCTVSSVRTCRSINFTGYTGTFAGSGTINIAGGITLSPSMNLTYSGAWVCNGTSSFNITSNGKTFPGNVQFTGIGGSWTLQDDLTMNGGGTGMVMSGGTFNSNDFNVTARAFSCSGNNTRVVNMGSGTWTTQGQTPSWSVSGSNYTINAGSSTIKYSSSNAIIACSFTGAGATYNNLWFALTANQPLNVSGSNTFNDFKVDAGRTVQFTAGTTTTMSSFTAIGTSANPITIGSTTSASHSLSKPSGTVNADWLVLSYSTAGGGATWNATNTVDNGNNSGWNITPPPFDFIPTPAFFY